MFLSSALVALSAARSQIDLPLQARKFTPCVAIRRHPAPGLLFGRVAMLEEPDSADSTPVSPYAAAKWAASGYGRMFRRHYKLDVRILRPMMTFGPGQKEFKVVPSTILSLLRNRRAKIGSGSRLVDWIYIDDVVEGLVAAACAPDLPCTIDLGSGVLVSVADVAREIARQLGREHLLEIGEGARGEERICVADVEAARRLIGFEASTGLAEGISSTIESFASFTIYPTCIAFDRQHPAERT